MIRFAMMPLLFALCACQHDTVTTQPGSTPQPELPSTGDAADPPANEAAFVLPGDFSERTSVADLEARFGKANVKITGRPDADGFYHSVVLFPDDPTRRAFVDFYEDQPLSGVRSILVHDRGSKWRGKHGAHVGMSFADLRRINGKSFYFTGFDNEHHGWVRDSWSPAPDDDDGRLGALDVGEGEHMYFNVDLGLRGATKDIPAGEYPVGEISISSDDPRYPRLGELIEVTAISATTSRDDDWE